MSKNRDIADLGNGITTEDIDDGAITSGKFASSALVGTVSESGGVPTGAIIERGSNANGEYVKFADGTMIARRRFFVTGISVAGSGYYSLPVWTYPVSGNTSSSEYHVAGFGVPGVDEFLTGPVEVIRIFNRSFRVQNKDYRTATKIEIRSTVVTTWF